MNKKINLTLAIVLVIAFSGISFLIGYKLETKNRTTAFNPENMMNEFRAGPGERNLRGANMAVNNGQFGGQLLGEIIKLEDNNLTLSLGEQGSRLIYLNDETIISKNEVSDRNELEIGKNISVNGTLNDNQSLIANTIQIR